jgi:phosphatidylglycerophosphatase A
VNAIIKKSCVLITSCGMSAHIPLGSLFCSLYAFPLILLIRVVHRFLPAASPWFIGLLLVVSFFALWLALRLPAQEQPVVTIDKVCGMIIAFAYVPLSWKIAIVGFCAFHLVRMLLPFVAQRLAQCDFYRYGAFWGYLLLAGISGLLVNVLLQIMVWVGK